MKYWYVCECVCVCAEHWMQELFAVKSPSREQRSMGSMYLNLHFSTPADTLQSQASFTPFYMHGHAVNSWVMHLIFTPSSPVSLLSAAPCPYLILGLAYHTLHTCGLSLVVKFYAPAGCSPIGRVCLYQISSCAWWNGLPPTSNTLHFGCS